MGRNLRFYVGGAGCLDHRVNIRPGTWHTIVCVYDGAVLSEYLDGALVAEQAVSGPLNTSTSHFTIARYDQVGPEWTFKGDVDFVRLYRHALEPWMALRATPRSDTSLDLDWASTGVAVEGETAVWHQAPKIAQTPHGNAADLSGGLTVPFSEWLGDTFAAETSFMLRSVEGMPVLINQGLWPGEGFMLQVLSKKLRRHIGGVGSLDCDPELEPDRWYSVKCTYDGKALRAYLDGEKIGELVSSAPMVPSLRPLRIGRYETGGAQYVVDGLIGPTRICPLGEE